MGKRWKQRPPGSNWGDFGPDDQLGRLNLLTAEKVRQGIAEVREGRTFCLSLPLDLPGGMALHARRKPPRVSGVKRDGIAQHNFPFERLDPAYIDVLNDDELEMALQYSTQWDALAHIGARFDADGDGIDEIVYYNGFRAGEHVRGPVDFLTGQPTGAAEPYGAHALSVAPMAAHGIQGRAVLVDLLAHFGAARRLVTFADLDQAMRADGITVESGDILLLRTGFADALVAMGGRPDAAVLNASYCQLDGNDPALLDWVAASGLVAIAADNDAVEAAPARKLADGRRSSLPLHHLCLFKLGIPLGEYWWLGELADWLRANGRSRCLLTAPPLRLPLAVGSPVSPVATV